MSVEEVVDQVTIHLAGAQLVVLSGGEPLAQVPPRAQGSPDEFMDDEDDPVGTLIRQLSWRNIATHIETAGIRKPSATVHTYVERYVVSPKLASSGNNLAARRNDHVLEFFADTAKADFKFVITEPTDFTEIQHLANFHNITRDRIWVMPQGTTAKELDRSARMVAEGALKRGYNFSDRLHIRIWGEARKH
jgi:organic radical activating enzyme